MLMRRFFSSLLPGILAICVLAGSAQVAPDTPPYNLRVSVDEVELTFHATDRNGAFVNNLSAEELRILDNGRPPRRTVLFESLRDLPIRAGILIDTSSSMEGNRMEDQSIAVAYAQRILARKSDQAFVMSFGRRSEVRQIWSSDPAALTQAIYRSGISPSTTAIYDAVYAACRNQFGKLDHARTGNFILLFTDGEDDASSFPVRAVVDMCQQTNTSIYAFRADSGVNFSSGPRNLSELASLTGGHVFRDNASAVEIEDDLHIIQENLRNQYRLIYNPEDLKRDGTFHNVVILPPVRVVTVNARLGYYAPAK
jgi:VWFA-related protein